MGLETGVSKIADLNVAWPLTTDSRSKGYAHLQNVKLALASLLTNRGQIGLNLKEQTITGNTTITYSGTPIGVLLVVLTINATGGYTIGWDSIFEGAPVNLNTSANNVLALAFIATSGNKWRYVGSPLLDLVSIKWAAGTEPVASEANRGMVVFVQGGTGVADTLRICTKDESDSYGWRALF